MDDRHDNVFQKSERDPTLLEIREAVVFICKGGTRENRLRVDEIDPVTFEVRLRFDSLQVNCIDCIYKVYIRQCIRSHLVSVPRSQQKSTLRDRRR